MALTAKCNLLTPPLLTPLLLNKQSLEVKRQHNHLAARLVHRPGVHLHVLVAQAVGVLRVETIQQTVTEFEFGAKLEERQVDVTSKSYFKENVVTLQLYVVVIAAGKVNHGVKSGHDVRARVVQTRRAENQVERHADVDRLHVLRLHDGLSVLKLVRMVAECKVTVAEVHRRSHPEGEISAKPQLAEHANVEAHVPSVLVAGYKFLRLRAIFRGYHLRPDVVKLHVLKMRADDYSEVERPQVGVRAVLHRAALGV